MFIKSCYKIFESASKDKARPSITMVQIEKLGGIMKDARGDDYNGILTATDGFVLSRVPVMLEADDHIGDGLISADALRQVWDKTDEIRITIDKSSVVLNAKKKISLRYLDEEAGTMKFPDFTPAIPDSVSDSKDHRYDVDHLVRVTKSINDISGLRRVIIQSAYFAKSGDTSNTQVFIVQPPVRPKNVWSGGMPQLPFSVLMGVTYSD